jgi:hypothetical protein
MTSEEFEACFDRFRLTVFRLEGLPTYDVPEEVERIAAWRAGRARPERSVRTSPWLSRIATTTAAGKSWRRLRLVEFPLADYIRYELGSYVESQACGEEIRIAERPSQLAGQPDFWLFDGDEPDTYAAAMHYDERGRFLGAELVTDDQEGLAKMREARDMAWAAGTPLNEFLVSAAAQPLRVSA